VDICSTGSTSSTSSTSFTSSTSSTSSPIPIKSYAELEKDWEAAAAQKKDHQKKDHPQEETNRIQKKEQHQKEDLLQKEDHTQEEYHTQEGGDNKVKQTVSKETGRQAKEVGREENAEDIPGD
jgi:hypothetical protein